jgi:hypothetical protein
LRYREVDRELVRNHLVDAGASPEFADAYIALQAAAVQQPAVAPATSRRSWAGLPRRSPIGWTCTATFSATSQPQQRRNNDDVVRYVDERSGPILLFGRSTLE